MEDNVLSGIDIFSGAGGMSIGAELAGIKIQYAIENDSCAAETFALNHSKTNVIQKDISKVSLIESVKKRPFVLFGGPPCQGFSLSNTKTRTSNNPNNLLFEEFLRFVKELNPIWVVFENVEGFKNFEKGGVVKELKDRLFKLGYISNSKILWASDYGVPQNRNRFFLVANSIGLDYTFPEKQNLKITVNDAIGDLPNLKNGDSIFKLPYKSEINNEYVKMMRKNSEFSYQNYVSKNKDYVLDRYQYIKQGENWKSIPSELMKNYSKVDNTHSGIYKRLDPNLPSVVISNYRKNMLIHPFEDRGLSVREAARLQSFPDNFIFKGTLMHIQQQIGNAVPPLLAKAVFDSIISITDVKKRISRTEKKRLTILEV